MDIATSVAKAKQRQRYLNWRVRDAMRLGEDISHPLRNCVDFDRQIVDAVVARVGPLAARPLLADMGLPLKRLALLGPTTPRLD